MKRRTGFIFILFFLVSFVFLPSTVKAERFFGTTSTWYTKVPANPTLYAHSADYIARLVESQNTLLYNKATWSVPIFYATASTPLTNVHSSTTTAGEMDILVPIPDGALPAGYALSVLKPGSYVRDSHMSIISADRKWAWDFFRTYKNPTTGAWTSSTWRKWNLESTGVMQPYPPTDTNVTPAGAAAPRVCPTTLLHGLVTYKEAVTDKVIDHALAFLHGGTVPYADHLLLGRLAPVYPCAHPTNSGWHDDQWSPPLGMRFQMDPTIDLDTLGLTETERVIATALQEYGMIYIENTSPNENSIYLQDLEYETGKTWDGLLGSKIKLSMFRAVEPIYPSSSSSSATSTSTTTTSTSSTSSANILFDAVRVLNVISVDGALTESAWMQAAPVTFSNSVRSNNTASMKLLWDRTAIYVGADITDSEINTAGASLWLDDSIEVFFDTGMSRSTALDSDDVQVIVNAIGEVSLSGVQAAVKTKTGGYILEVKIPWSILNKSPEYKGSLGVLLVNNDRDGSTVGIYDDLGIIDVPPNIFKRPNLWGSLNVDVSNTWKQGDYTNDTAVGLPDFAVFAEKYKTSGVECEYDLVGDDCYLSIGDFQTFAANYGS